MKIKFIKKILSALLLVILSFMPAYAQYVTVEMPEDATSYIPNGAISTIVYTAFDNQIYFEGSTDADEIYLFTNKDYVSDAVIKNPELLKEGTPISIENGRFRIEIKADDAEKPLDQGLLSFLPTETFHDDTLIKDSYPNRFFIVAVTVKISQIGDNEKAGDTSTTTEIIGTPVLLIKLCSDRHQAENPDIDTKALHTPATRAMLAEYLFDALHLDFVAPVKLFDDLDRVPYPLSKKIYTISHYGYMIGDNQSFFPHEFVTYSQAAIVIERAFGKKISVPDDSNSPISVDELISLLKGVTGGMPNE